MLVKYLLPKRLLYFFSTAQNYDLYNKAKQRLISFPYTNFNEKVHKLQLTDKPNDFLKQNIIEDSVAYASLTEFRQMALSNFYTFLFKEIKKSNELSGNEIFVRHFSQKLQKIQNTIRDSNNQEQINYCLKTLFYLKNANYKINIQKFHLNKIIKQGKISQKAYLLHILSEEKNFLQFVELFNQKFKSQTHNQRQKAAFIILSIPQFHKKLPSSLCQQSIDLVGEGLRKLDDWQIYRVMQYIFQTNFPSTRRLADKIMDQLLGKTSDNNSNTKIPVLIKAIKLRDALKMDNKKFQQIIKNNPLKFNSIFFKKKLNKQPFLDTVASKDSKRILPAQISSLFNSYIVKSFEQIIQKQQCEVAQIMQIVKLSLKFYSNIQNQKLIKIVRQIQQKLLPMFDQHYQISFWLIILLVRIDRSKLKLPQIGEYVSKLIVHYQSQYKKTTQQIQKSVKMQRISQLYYQLIRCGVKLPKQFLRKMLELDFRDVRTFQQVIYVCYIIINVQLTNQQKYKIFDRLSIRIQYFLKQYSFRSFKNLFTVLSAMQHSKCQAFAKNHYIFHLYANIQKNIMRNLFKQTLAPPRKDLIFLKNIYKQLKNNQQKHLYFSKFIKFLDGCLDNPQEFKKHYKQYQQSFKNVNIYHQNQHRKKKSE